MEEKDKTLTFVPYDKKSEEQKEEIAKFNTDLLNRVDGYDRFIQFGLLYNYSIKDLLDLHEPISSINEKVMRYFVYDKGTCVGIIILDWCKLFDQNTNALNVYYLLIKPSEMHKGYGTKIMKELMTNGANIIGKKFSEINLSVDIRNEACQRMSEKLGFIREGKSGYYYLYSWKQNTNGKNFNVPKKDIEANGKEVQETGEKDSIFAASCG